MLSDSSAAVVVGRPVPVYIYLQASTEVFLVLVQDISDKSMRIVLQRVSEASVNVSNTEISRIGPGLLLLVGIDKQDTAELIEPAVKKIIEMRIFSRESGRFDASIQEVNGHLLVVSQFTLLGATKKGRRPDFSSAMRSEDALVFFEKFVDCCNQCCPGRVAVGQFGAHMHVQLSNDGPVTLVLDFN